MRKQLISFSQVICFVKYQAQEGLTPTPSLAYALDTAPACFVFGEFFTPHDIVFSLSPLCFVKKSGQNVFLFQFSVFTLASNDLEFS